jgi:hypothetical protein
VANVLLEDERHAIETLERDLNKNIIIKVDHNFHQDYYQIIPL